MRIRRFVNNLSRRVTITSPPRRTPCLGGAAQDEHAVPARVVLQPAGKRLPQERADGSARGASGAFGNVSMVCETLEEVCSHV